MALGRPPKEGESETIKLTVPKPLYGHLLTLARTSYAGASVQEVASYLLKQSIAELVKLEITSKSGEAD